MKMIIMSIIAVLVSSNVYALWPKCEELNQKKSSSEEFDKKWRVLEREMRGEDKSRVSSKFLIELRHFVKDSVNQNRNRMELLKGCFDITSYPSQKQKILSSLNIDKSLWQNFSKNCKSVTTNLNKKISASWPEMRRNLELSKVQVQATTSNPSNYSPSTRVKPILGRFPVTSGQEKHSFPGSKQGLAPLSRFEANIINKIIFEKMTEAMAKFGFSSSFVKNLNQLSYADKLTTLKNRMLKAPQKYIDVNSSLNKFLYNFTRNYIDDYKRKYFLNLGEFPLLAFLPSKNPKASEISKALEAFIENSKKLEKKLEAKNWSKISLKQLTSFKPLINRYLEQKVSECTHANGLSEAIAKREKHINRLYMVGAAAAVTSCVAGAFTATTGVGATLLVGCTVIGGGMSLTDLYKASVDRGQISKELALSERELLGRDFKSLTKAEQEQFLAVSFLVLEYFGVGQVAKSVNGVRSSQRIKNIVSSSKFNAKLAHALNDTERVAAFEELLQIKLSPAEGRELIRAHQIGAGFGKYTYSDLRAKTEVVRAILSNHNVGSSQSRIFIRALMERGIVGSIVDSKAEWKLIVKEVGIPNKKASVKLLNTYSDLPEAAVEGLKRMRKETGVNKFTKIDIKYKNPITELEDKNLIELMSKYPKMKKPIITASEKLGSTHLFANYLEEIYVEVFREMIKHGGDDILKMVNKGEISRSILLEVFEKRFATRGLKISRIPVANNNQNPVLSSKKFQAYLKKGPLLDDAMGPDSQLPSHGPYPHLFQLDFVIDDMLKASDGSIKKAQEFFNFFGGKPEGIAVWNDVFDLFFGQGKELTKKWSSARDTFTITTKFLKQIDIVDDSKTFVKAVKIKPQALPKGEVLEATELYSARVQISPRVTVNRPKPTEFVNLRGSVDELKELKSSSGAFKIRESFKLAEDSIDGFDINEQNLKSTLELLNKMKIDKNLRKGIISGFKTLNDKKALKEYFVQLQADTFELMLKRGGEFADFAEEGIINGKIVEEVLRNRASKRGLNVVVISSGNSSTEFLDSTKYGMIVDEAFNAGSAHGINVHFLQQDFMLPIMVKESGKTFNQVMKTFSRSMDDVGMSNRLWDHIFDPMNRTAGHPEHFGPNVVRPILDLAFTPKKNKSKQKSKSRDVATEEFKIAN